MVEALRRANGERRGFLVVKRAAGLEFAASFLELDAAAKHLNDICSRDQIVDEVLWYQAAHNIVNGYSAFQGSTQNSIIIIVLAWRGSETLSIANWSGDASALYR
jgi:hypothetical protein